MQLEQEAMNSPNNLILRRRGSAVSKDGNAHLVCCPSFETRAGGALLRMR